MLKEPQKARANPDLMNIICNLTPFHACSFERGFAVE